MACLHVNSWTWHWAALVCTNTTFLHFRSLKDLLLSGNISVSISISRKLSRPLYGTETVLFLGLILVIRMFSCTVVRLDGLNLNFQDLDILNPDGLLDHQMSGIFQSIPPSILYNILTFAWNGADNV
jgi:hypothetical protein